jgi:hypothetical protein
MYSIVRLGEYVTLERKEDTVQDASREAADFQN